MRAGDVEIVVARYAGYCYGVERALRTTEEALEGAVGPVASLGPIIHNPTVVKQLEQRGVAVVDDVEQAEAGTLIVRTHGVAPGVVERPASGACAWSTPRAPSWPWRSAKQRASRTPATPS